MENKKKGMGLSSQIFIALLVGLVSGLGIFYLLPKNDIIESVLVEGVLYLGGTGFIRAMQMLVVPLVFSSIVCGSMAIGDTRTLGKVGGKTIAFYLVTTGLAISIALLVGTLVNPGVGLDLEAINSVETQVAESQTVVDTLLNIIPTNPVSSLASGNMLQIIFFAILVGLILAPNKEKDTVVASFFTQFNDIMMAMTLMVMKVAPIGVFCLVARTFSQIGLDGFIPMIKYMSGVLLGLAVQCFVVYLLMLKLFAKKSPITFLKKFAPVMGFAFSTSSSNATIPLTVSTLDKRLGVSKRISSFTIPLGATINMDGTAIMQGVAVVFVAQVYGVLLTPMDYATVILTATLASIGTAGVPGVGLITLSMVLASVGLPVEGIGLIMGIDRILDMTRTAVNITGDAVCTIIVASQEGEVDDNVFNQEVIA